MQIKIHDISSVSHMTMHDGKSCDKYTATVKIGIVGRQGWGGGTWYLRVYARTVNALEQKLKRFRTDQTLEIGEAEIGNLYNGGRKYGGAQN